MSYRPKIKTNTSGGLTDFPLDAETVKGVDVVNTKQDLLVDSGADQNIKTINGSSILGSGDLTITAVASDEKARKLLGEFDIYPAIISGVANDKKALRETSYKMLEDIEWTWESEDLRWRSVSRIDDIYYTTAGSYVPEIKTPKYDTISIYAQNVSTSVIGITTYEGYIYLRNGSSTEKPSGLMQYHSTSTSYYDDVIPSGQILNLDNNGCAFVREEWEKGLNLLPSSCLNVGKGIDGSGNLTTNASYNAYYKVPVIPNTTYTISYNGNSFNMGVATYNSSGTFVSYGSVPYVSASGGNVITIPSNVYYISFDYPNTYSNNMMNYTSHAYPYQVFYGKIMHEKDVSDNYLKLSGGSITGPISFADGTALPNKTSLKYMMGIDAFANGGQAGWISIEGLLDRFFTSDMPSSLPRLQVNAPIFGFNYSNDNNKPAFVLDKPGSNYSGIGAHGIADTIWFGACSSNANDKFAWIDSYKQKWKFNGDIISDTASIGDMVFYRTNEIDVQTSGELYLGSRNASKTLIGISGTHACNLQVNGAGKFKGRFYGSGDDEGIIVECDSNGYAGITLGEYNSNNHATLYYNIDRNESYYRFNGYNLYHPGNKNGTIAITDDIKWFTLLWSGNSTNATNYDGSSYSHFLVKLTYGGWVICKNGDDARFVYGTDYTTSSFYIFFSSIVCANTSASISSYKYYVASGNVYKDSYTNYISEVYGFNL